jgi:VWFA-related protein
MHQKFRFTLFVTVLLLVFPGVRTALANQEEADRFKDTVEVTEVLLDVLVTDRSGNIVAGLGPDDFVVEVSGNPVNLTGATFYSTRYAADSGATPMPNEVPASRYFIFFFHDQRIAALEDSRLLRQQRRAAQESRQWLETEMGPSDWVAVAGYDVKLKIFQDFTQSREALEKAIDAAARGFDPEPERMLRRQEVPATQPSLVRDLAMGKELRRKTTRIYDGLRLLAEATGHIVGRKNLLLFSIGFGRLDGVNAVAIPDRRYYPELEEALNANNVAVYTIDLTPSESDHLQADFLSVLASDTGGYYYQHFVSFLTPLRKISEESTGYYLLSHRAEHPVGDSGYREVEVRAREAGFRVRAPKGYRFGG